MALPPISTYRQLKTGKKRKKGQYKGTNRDMTLITACPAFVAMVDKPATVDADKLTIHWEQNLAAALFTVALVYCIFSLYQHTISDSWLWLVNCTYPARIQWCFALCTSSYLSLFTPLTQVSNNIRPLGEDKCGCCDKELGEGTMQSVSISSNCHSSSDPLVDVNVSSMCVTARLVSMIYRRYSVANADVIP